jgi:hypothetical protein
MVLTIGYVVSHFMFLGQVAQELAETVKKAALRPLCLLLFAWLLLFRLRPTDRNHPSLRIELTQLVRQIRHINASQELLKLYLDAVDAFVPPPVSLLSTLCFNAVDAFVPPSVGLPF